MAEKKTTPAPAAAAPAPAPAPEPVAAAAASAPETTAPEKRGRGRPRKDGPAAPVSPSEAGAAATAPKKKAGRPPKSRSAMSADAVEQIAKQMQGLHQLAALATGIPELQIDSTEATMLSAAVINVCEEYDLSLSGKTGALLQLAAAAAMVYAPRFVVVNNRVKQAKAQRDAERQPKTSPHPPLSVVAGTDTHDTTPPASH